MKKRRKFFYRTALINRIDLIPDQLWALLNLCLMVAYFYHLEGFYRQKHGREMGLLTSHVGVRGGRQSKSSEDPELPFTKSPAITTSHAPHSLPRPPLTHPWLRQLAQDTHPCASGSGLGSKILWLRLNLAFYEFINPFRHKFVSLKLKPR